MQVELPTQTFRFFKITFNYLVVFKWQLFSLHWICFRMMIEQYPLVQILRGKTLSNWSLSGFRAKSRDKIIVAPTSSAQNFHRIKRTTVPIKVFTRVWIYTTLAPRRPFGFSRVNTSSFTVAPFFYSWKIMAISHVVLFLFILRIGWVTQIMQSKRLQIIKQI